MVYNMGSQHGRTGFAPNGEYAQCTESSQVSGLVANAVCRTGTVKHDSGSLRTVDGQAALDTLKILVVILTTIPWLIFITTLSSRPLDDTVVTHVISIGNLNLRDESVVTNDEHVIN